MRATDATYYNIKRLHLAFAGASLALLAVTVWMLVADHAREWKVYQRTFRDRVEPWATEAAIRQQEADAADNDSAASGGEIERLQRTLARQRPSAGKDFLRLPLIDAWGRSLAIEQVWLPELTINYHFRQVARFDRCTTCHQGIDKALPRSEEPVYLAEQVLSMALATPKAPPPAAEGETVPTLAALYGFTLTGGILAPRVPTVAAVLPKSAAAWAQLLPGDVIAKIGGAEMACREDVEQALRTNVTWGKPLSLEIRRGLPHPYRSHPRLDLFVGSHSPHPMADFGCTICHDGQGSATAFQFASHSPNTESQRAAWRRRHDWFWNHDWEYPMRPSRFAQSNCLKCHHDVSELEPSRRFPDPPAAKLVAGYHLVLQNGCFGCHEIRGVPADTDQRIGPDLRLEPSRLGAGAEAPRGTLRRVGPSLRDVASKLDAAFVQRFVAAPADFRPQTRMPQFFGMHEHLDAENLQQARRLESVELQAMARYLEAASQPAPAAPAAPRVSEPPSAERGQRLLVTQGCVACHKHQDVPAAQATQGPDLSRLAEKLGTPTGAKWLADWLRDPVRHSPRTVMPNPRLQPIPLPAEAAGRGATPAAPRMTDPVADLAAYLLKPSLKPEAPAKDPLKPESPAKDPLKPEAPAKDPLKPETPAKDPLKPEAPAKDPLKPEAPAKAPSNPDDRDLDALAALYLAKAFPASAVEGYLREGIPQSSAGTIRGDAVELLGPITRDKKLRYVGRATIRKRGCFGCHEVPGFDDAPPIGPALSDWGRKQESLLAFEQVRQFLETTDAAEPGTGAGDADQEFYREAIQAGRREGFLWQKLRAPRSFDYQKAAAKTFNEHLLMGRFRLSEAEREALMTFVLGLVAEPAGARVYRPDPRRKAMIEGRKVIDAQGCAQCHTLEMERWTVEAESDKTPTPPPLVDYEFLKPHVAASELAASRRTDRRGLCRAQMVGSPQVNAEGKPEEAEDEEGNPAFAFLPWEPAVIAGKVWPVGGAGVVVSARQIAAKRPPLGGDFARLLYPVGLAEARAAGSTAAGMEAWGWGPPPLVHEGRIVQPAWLHEYLLAPYIIRPAALLRMPKFNLSSSEAAALVDYFAATAGAEFPYAADSRVRLGGGDDVDPPRAARMDKAMRFLTDRTTYCAKCHLVGDYGPGGESKTVLAPRLDRVAKRIRPEYLRRWLANPKSVLPYTAMPVNFPPDRAIGQEIYPGSSLEQLDAVVELLVNYDIYIRRRVSVRKLAEPAN